MKPAAFQVGSAPSGDDGRTSQDQPLRLLVLRERVGELPWVVKTITALMAPVEVVQVSGLGKALGRLGREHFDSVFLDLPPAEPGAIEACRRHIAEIAAIPVLDLNEEPAATSGPAEPTAAPANDRSTRWRSKATKRGAGKARVLLRAI